MTTSSKTDGTRSAIIEHQTNDILGESPVWCWRSRRLIWTDIKSARLWSLDPITDAILTHPMPGDVSSVSLAKGGGYLLVVEREIQWVDERFQYIESLGMVDKGLPDHRGNDARVDREGCLWIGTMHQSKRDPVGSLYRLSGRKLEEFRSGIIVPNCLAWSPKGDVMYFTDTWSGVIEAFESPKGDANDGLGQGRTICSDNLPGVPDGATVDEEGGFWHARYGGGCIVRIGLDGQVTDRIELPAAQITACALGGPDMRTLFVTSARQRMSQEAIAREPAAGSLFSLSVDIAGLREVEFRLPEDIMARASEGTV